MQSPSQSGRWGPPHHAGAASFPELWPTDVTAGHGKWPDLTSSPSSSFCSSFHGNGHLNAGKKGEVRFFKIMIAEKLSWACVSCSGSFHGNSNPRQSWMETALGVFHGGNCRGSQGRPSAHHEEQEHLPSH